MKGDHLKSYNEVVKLNKRELKDICKAHEIAENHGKTALVVIVCQALGIATTGQDQRLLPRVRNHGLGLDQLQEYASMTLAKVQSIPGDTKLLDRVPEIDDFVVKRFLLDSESITTEMTRKYKLSRPYKLKEMIHSVSYNELESSRNFSVLKAKCNPSQSTCEDDVKSLFCLFDKCAGRPLGGFCSCTAGTAMVFFDTNWGILLGSTI